MPQGTAAGRGIDHDHAVRRAQCAACCPADLRGSGLRPGLATARNAARRDAAAHGRRTAAGRDRGGDPAGRPHLYPRRLRPLRAAQRARHADQRAGLLDRRRRHRAARPRPGDRQRADQRRALFGQVHQCADRAAADQRLQCRQDRGRRRRDPEHIRPVGADRQYRDPAGRPVRQFHLEPAAAPGPHRGAPARRRGLAERRARRRDHLYFEPAQQQLPQRQCRAGAGDRRHRRDHRPARRGVDRLWRPAPPLRLDPAQFRQRLGAQPQRGGRLQHPGRRGERGPHRPGSAGPDALRRGAHARPQLRTRRRLRARARQRPPEADRASPLHQQRFPPDPDPDLFGRARRRSASASARPATRARRSGAANIAGAAAAPTGRSAWRAR